jgi:hypothetical protein
MPNLELLLARHELSAVLDLPGALLALGGAIMLVLVWQAATQRALYAARATAASERKRKGELALELMKVRNGLMHSEESIRKGQHPEFVLRWSDIVIVTYPKCGTVRRAAPAHTSVALARPRRPRAASFPPSADTTLCVRRRAIGVVRTDMDARHRARPALRLRHGLWRDHRGTTDRLTNKRTHRARGQNDRPALRDGVSDAPTPPAAHNPAAHGQHLLARAVAA